MSAATPGTWNTKYPDAETGHRDRRSLGAFTELAASLRYNAAKRAAEQWSTHLGNGGTPEAVTVEAACRNDGKHVRDTRGDKPADDLDMRFKRWVYEDSLAGTALGTLTKTKVEALDDMAERKALASKAAHDPALLLRGPSLVLTVAQLSGTSVIVIERRYGHLSADHAAAALSALAF